MSAFDEVRLDLPLAFGARGGPETAVDVVRLASGGEARNARWSGVRRRWEAGGATLGLADAAALGAFFEARGGRLRGFRYRDVLDWKSCGVGEEIAATDQGIGVGDGVETSFQLVKAYVSGAVSWVRTIAKPVAGSVVVAVDGVSTSAFSLDGASGVVTMDVAPAAAAVVTAGFAFDAPVRFDVERLELSAEGADLMRVEALSLVEVVG